MSASALAAGVPVKCGLAHAVMPLLNTVVGNIVGLAYVWAPIAIVAAVALAVLLSANRGARSTLVSIAVWTLGGIVLLGLIGGILTLVVQPHC